ncbi:DUF2953 domain-containing protein [Alicyclobacillaceae bacterium I2511]|jgi:hypothetical protein|nr:DUF2953 domain-containing protein [Alicyclobacillaceae bacterium I2511]
MTVWMILGLVFTFLLLLLWTALWLPVQIVTGFSHRSNSTKAELVIRYAFGLIRLHRDLTDLSAYFSDEGPALALHHDPLKTDNPLQPRHTEWTLEEAIRLLKHLPTLWPKIERTLDLQHRLLARTYIQDLQIHVDIGTGEASTTGLLCGVCWTGLSFFLGKANQFTTFQELPVIQVRPHFQTAILEGNFNCIFQMRAGYAIWTGLAIMRLWRRR